jgi:hypothetical protein
VPKLSAEQQQKLAQDAARAAMLVMLGRLVPMIFL